MALDKDVSANIISMCLVVFYCQTLSADALDEHEGESVRYSNTWVIQLKSSHAEEDQVKIIADSVGLKYRKFLDELYILTDKNRSSIVYEERSDITNALAGMEKVLWVKQQVYEEYSSRFDSSRKLSAWQEEHYRPRRSTSDINHNIEYVWNDGYSGKGVTVVVIDDGLRHTHHDLKDNYNASVSGDLIDNDDDPTSPLGHGTNCAGVIAAARGNGLCGDGVAYNSSIGGVRLFESSLATDAAEAEVFYPGEEKARKIHIFSNSWGPKDVGNVVRGPKELASGALKKGVEKGRNGSGSIYVFSSGNGGIPFGDSCAYDGYVNSIYTIAVASITAGGDITHYAENCGAIMTAVVSDNMNTTDVASDTACKSDFGQTSAAAALVSGIIALALEANPRLSWRDVQYLVAISSRQDKVKDPNLVTNKANYTVSQYFGFGVLDARLLVKNAIHWTTKVAPQVKCVIAYNGGQRTIPTSFNLNVLSTSCGGVIIKSLEHVQLRITLVYKPRGFLVADVTSPSKTTSRFLHARVVDAITQATNFTNLVVTNVHFWGETSLGEWKISIFNSKGDDKGEGSLFNAELILYGTNGNGNNEGSLLSTESISYGTTVGSTHVGGTTVNGTAGNKGNGNNDVDGKGESSGVSSWIIVVAVVGSVAFVAILVAVVVFINRESQAKQNERVQDETITIENKTSFAESKSTTNDLKLNEDV